MVQQKLDQRNTSHSLLNLQVVCFIDEDEAVLDEYNIIHGSTTTILAVIKSTQLKYKQVPALSDICPLASEE